MLKNPISVVDAQAMLLRFSLVDYPMATMSDLSCVEAARRPGLIELPIAVLGTYYHTKYKKFTITQETLDQIRVNFEQRTIGFDPFLTIGHVSDTSVDDTKDPLASSFSVQDSEENHGYLVEMVQRFDVLYGRYQPRTLTLCDEVDDGRWMFSSAELYFDMPNQKTGKKMGTVLVCHALTNKPFMPNLPMNSVIRRFSQTTGLASPVVVEIPMNGLDAAVPVTDELIAMLQAPGASETQEDDPMPKFHPMLEADAGSTGAPAADPAAAAVTPPVTPPAAAETPATPPAGAPDPSTTSTEDETDPKAAAANAAQVPTTPDPLAEAIAKLSAADKTHLAAVVAKFTAGTATMPQDPPVTPTHTPAAPAVAPAPSQGASSEMSTPTPVLTQAQIESMLDAKVAPLLTKLSAAEAANSALEAALATANTKLSATESVAQSAHTELAKFSASESQAKLDARRTRLLEAGTPPAVIEMAMGAAQANGLAKFSVGDQELDVATAGLAALELLTEMGGLQKFSQAGQATEMSTDDFKSAYPFLPAK